jgi:sterol desaturase/sphingolipid hydroxylase (fatty acid hydroxylase superfamily)
MTDTLNSLPRKLVRWGLYPFSWAVLLTGFYFINHGALDDRTIWGISSGSLAALYFIIEFTLPYQKRWSMTWKSFLADFRFILVNSGAGLAISAGLALFTITTSGQLIGPASDWPIPAQVVAALMIFEAINYTLHRLMHEGRGPFGKWMWSVHAAHHLPPRLYLVMHAVFHPINALFIQALALTIPVWLMGYSQEAVAMFFMINGMHGLISHFNVDVRMGWANYIFVGTELHRYHHSADVNEAKNYGATLSIYDLLFGTFVYHPGVPPEELGVHPDTGLPAYERTFAVLSLPFRSGQNSP